MDPLSPIHRGLRNRGTSGKRRCCGKRGGREWDRGGGVGHRRRRLRIGYLEGVELCSACSEGKVARDRVGIGFVGVKEGLEATCRLGCTKLDWLLCEARSGLVLLDLLGFPTPFSHTTVRRVTDSNWVSLLPTHKQTKR